MSITLHDLTVPVFKRGLTVIDKLLTKAQAFAREEGLPFEQLLDARLYPDMAPLTAQIQRASDAAKNCIVRIGGASNERFEDREVTFADLHARIARTQAFFARVDPESFVDPIDVVQVPMPNGPVRFLALDYVLQFAVPNFFFHVTTTYGLLRREGVPLGKLNYLGSFDA